MGMRRLWLLALSLWVLMLGWLPFPGPGHAQYIQSWQWIAVNGQEEPHWRPTTADPLTRVIHFGQNIVYLEYNCYYMKAICQNARTYLTSAIGSSRRWRSAFSYDMKTSHGDHPTKGRRQYQCPSGSGPRSWSRTHTCPEAAGPGNLAQPAVMGRNAAWWTTDVEPSPGNYHQWEIKAQRDAAGNVIARSGRRYSCEEFPAAKWVEGGGGTPGQNVSPEGDGELGYTRCAPIAMKCGSTPAIASEQNWQGQIHGHLRRKLLALGAGRVNRPVKASEAVMFFFRMVNEATKSPARVLYYDDAANTETELEKIARREEFRNLTTKEIWDWADQVSVDELINMHGYVADEAVLVNASHSAMRLAGLPDLFFDHVPDAREHRELLKKRQLRKRDPESDLSSTHVEPWNLTASKVDPDLATYKFVTHRQPQHGHPDLIEMSEEYILGQVGGSRANSTLPRNSTVTSAAPSLGRRKRQAGQGGLHTSPYTPLNRRDGPVQCGPGNPCVDDSCCNTDGKCGYKEAHCGAASCISNCAAKAMCGIDSADGRTPCALDLCCSYYGWCGTEAVHCKDPEPQYGVTPCQEGFGKCEIVSSPSCGSGSGTATGRRVGYYQGWNTRERSCDKVSPSQINTRGLTHLFYAFAFFLPATFQIMPMDDRDLALYGEFTSLKRNGLQTWIAIGGWSFNDPGPTQFAYSDMVSSAANRAAFIASLMEFMDTYGFQGADLDWEYPGGEERGGRAEDADNLVLLVKEMRAAFGSRYGLSLTLAPDYWYLRGFRPAQMQDHVDFMGFMAYDLHGPWDSDVKALGAKLRPHTDITEIDKDLLPLWFDGVDPGKINMGIAYYGRTYRLADASCSSMISCGFQTGSGGAAGECTAFSGVLSNKEIRGMLDADPSIVPTLNETAMVKYFAYGTDSWVGYDDEETLAMKESFANSRCLGGLMIWSVDFDAKTGGGNAANAHISPEDATVIPLPHTTVPARSTLTINSDVATDIAQLPYDGDQNDVPGPGADQCFRCSFFRLITSTCCGTGGSLGNPIEIAANQPVPVDIILPAGFIPPMPFVAGDGSTVAAGSALPKEATLPRGTVFPAPFVIPGGQPLRGGEGDDTSNEDLIWISPEIWNEPSPTIQCYPPCTFVLPPWPKFTSTIDYPRLTWSSGTFTTTITKPPLTITEWQVSTFVWDLSGSSPATTTSDAVFPFLLTPTLSTTTTWPTITWMDRGTSAATGSATSPPPPPPPPRSLTGPPIISITIGPPKPIVPKCLFPLRLICPPDNHSGSHPPVITGGTGPLPTATTFPPVTTPIPPGEPAAEEEDDDEEDEEDDTCLLPQDDDPNDDEGGDGDSGDGGGSGGDGGSGDGGNTDPDTPNPKENTVSCYNSGQTATRANLMPIIEGFCNSVSTNGRSIDGPYLDQIKFITDWDPIQFFDVVVVAAIEVKKGCRWVFDRSECRRYMATVVDGCDCSVTDYKQGGRGENNCLRWRLDPNNALS